MKTVVTDIGPVSIDVPRDRDGTFTPVIVNERQRRLSEMGNIVLSLTAKGLTSGEISAHLAEICDRQRPRKRSRGSPTRSPIVPAAREVSPRYLS